MPRALAPLANSKPSAKLNGSISIGVPGRCFPASICC